MGENGGKDRRRWCGPVYWQVPKGSDTGEEQDKNEKQNQTTPQTACASQDLLQEYAASQLQAGSRGREFSTTGERGGSCYLSSFLLWESIYLVPKTEQRGSVRVWLFDGLGVTLSVAKSRLNP